MTITARNIGRINVWPTYDVARDADTEASKYVGQLTVWRTSDEARANTSHEEEGGGGEDGPLIFIDFVNDTATNDGATVAIDTLVGSDPNTVNGWGATSYNPANLTTDGYLSNAAFAFIGDARDLVVAGSTVVVAVKPQDGPGANVTVSAWLLSEDGNFGAGVDLSGSALEVSSSSYAAQHSLISSIVNLYPGTNKIAFTLVPDRIDIAANGSTAETSVLGAEDVGDPYSFVAGIVDATDGTAIQSITIYAALPSTDGLSELSEI